MTKLVIMVAPNGARRSKRDHPGIPISAEDIGATACECMRAGAAAIHLHVRNGSGAHSLDAGRYRAAMDAVRARCGDGMVIQVTTEAAGMFTAEEQMASVHALCPPAISLSVKEILRVGEARALRFLASLRQGRITVQYILYDPEDVEILADWHRRRLLAPDAGPSLIVVAGRYGRSGDSSLADFDVLHRRLVDTGLDQNATWMCCAFGRGEMACLERAIALGGHVRVGFENAIVDAQGRPARDNAERVTAVAGLAQRAGRELATAGDAARILGIEREF